MLEGIRLVVTRAHYEYAARLFGVAGGLGLALGLIAFEIVAIGALNREIGATGTGSPLLWTAILGAPLAAVALHFAFAKCLDRCDAMVRNTVSRISGFAAFEVTGIVMGLAGLIGLTLVGKETFDLVKAPPASPFDLPLVSICAGGVTSTLCCVAGLLCINPGIMNVCIVDDATAGQDGLALSAAPLKALLAGCRLAVGLAASAGGALAVLGATMQLAHGPTAGKEWLLFGIWLCSISVLAPLAIYLFATYYYILVDVLDAIIRLGRLADNLERQKREA